MPISASVTNNQITATVGETQIDVAVSGGVGPTGSSGTVSVTAPITNAGTSTAAVIGISAGTGLAVSSGSLVVSYGTSGGTACEGNDARLSDSREWSASTVTQAEAEAGTSTTRRAFTPLRVFQAIAAWWAASAAKTKLDGIATGATANQTDAYLLSRANHTGTQLAATISDFTTAVIAAAPPTTDASLLTTGTLPDARLSSNIARTSDVTSAVAAVVGAAPESLNTLQELSAALANDASFATTVTNSLAAKAPINNPTFTGTVSGVTKAMVGLGNVDNTSDANKPISTAVQTALDGKAASSHAHAWSDIASGVPSTFAPSAHKTSHATGGSDALTPADIGAAPASNFDQGLTTVSIVNFGSVGTASLYLKDTTYVTELASGSLTAYRTITFPDAAGVVALVGHTHAASDITSGTIATARLGSGTASASNFLRGDGTWAAAGSTSASDLTSGTLANDRMTTRARAAINLYLWSSFR